MEWVVVFSCHSNKIYPGQTEQWSSTGGQVVISNNVLSVQFEENEGFEYWVLYIEVKNIKSSRIKP